MKTCLVALAAASLLGWGSACADTIHIGFTIAETGPAASLGMPQKNTVALMPKEIGGDAVAYTVLDDGGDATRAVANTRKLIDEDGADVIVGSSVTPSSLAMIGVVAEKKVPMISLAASIAIIAPMDDEKRWVFKTPQNDSLMADAVAESMAKNGIRSVGFIGFNDAYGDGWLEEATRAFAAREIKLAAVERFARTDTSVMGQVLKTTAAHPDAILIAASGTPAALPEKTLRVGGHDLEGTILPAGPVLVAAQLPDGNPIKPVALSYVQRYEAANGAGSFATFGAHAWDASLLLQQAIPVALQHGRPGTAEFRAALRDALEGLHEVVLTHGIATLSPQNHNGLDERARVMVEIHDGGWKLIQ
jgi:branched-chain amino acid transport system substrate-binding protein